MTGSSEDKAVTDQIDSAIRDYCDYHGVAPDDVDFTDERDGDGRMLRFRLSLDADGRQHGGDEWLDVDVEGGAAVSRKPRGREGARPAKQQE
jgi:hypothetical protein